MSTRRLALASFAAAWLCASTPALATNPSLVVDGVLDAGYRTAKSVQTVQTQFGNSNTGAPDAANGSELDAAYGVLDKQNLYLFLAGNLESNFNKLEIFIDSRLGGQNRLRGDNANVDFNGLNRMGDDGSGNGLSFESGVGMDYWLGITGGGGPYQLFANFAELLADGGGPGAYLGQGGAETDGTLSGGTNPHGIRITISNRNTGGVNDGCGAASGAGVTRGIELVIPLAAIGNPAGPIRVCTFVNGGNHDFVSNQVLGPLPGSCNLGEPRAVRFGSLPLTQYFTVDPSDSVFVPATSPAALALLSLGLAAVAALLLRRRGATV